MESFQHFLMASSLFDGVSAADAAALCSCLEGERRAYPAKAVLLHEGESVSKMGIVLTGNLHIVQEDWEGNAVIVARVLSGELFAEAFACSGWPLSVMVQATADSEVFWLEASRLMQPCEKACAAHRIVTENLLRLLAQKNVFLTGRIAHLAHRRLREKVLSYLTEQARLRGEPRFSIPFSRQELADYLSVDRSALSAMLSRLRDEGVLTYHKNEFTLL